MTSPTANQLLTIDCSAAQALVALWSGTQLLACRSTPPDSRTAVTLLPTIQQLYRDFDRQPRHTTLVAVTYGPGSFTSLRIGVTTAKCLAYAWKTPLVGLQALDVRLAAAWHQACQRPADSSRLAPSDQAHPPAIPSHSTVHLHAALPAYRGQVYGKSIALNPAQSARLAAPTMELPPNPFTRPTDPATSAVPPRAEAMGATALGTEPPGADTADAAPLGGSHNPIHPIASIPSAATAGQARYPDETPDELACRQSDPSETVWPEQQVTAHLWTTTVATSMLELRSWWQHASRQVDSSQASHFFVCPQPANGPVAGGMPGQPQRASAPSFAEVVGRGDKVKFGEGSAADPRWLAEPDAQNIARAMAWLTWWSLVDFPPHCWSPFRLQPVYYRPSAAEEHAR